MPRRTGTRTRARSAGTAGGALNRSGSGPWADLCQRIVSGASLRLDVHDSPRASPKNDRADPAGMVAYGHGTIVLISIALAGSWSEETMKRRATNRHNAAK